MLALWLRLNFSRVVTELPETPLGRPCHVYQASLPSTTFAACLLRFCSCFRNGSQSGFRKEARQEVREEGKSEDEGWRVKNGKPGWTGLRRPKQKANRLMNPRCRTGSPVPPPTEITLNGLIPAAYQLPPSHFLGPLSRLCSSPALIPVRLGQNVHHVADTPGKAALAHPAVYLEHAAGVGRNHLGRPGRHDVVHLAGQ